MTQHPYSNLPENAFWKTAISTRHPMDIADLARPIVLSRQDRIATAGSCFAQHIGNNLAARGAAFMDLEPGPAGWSPEVLREHGFGVYSCRYGNIYSTRQLLQLATEAIGGGPLRHEVWLRDGRAFDAFRPSVDPVGHDSAEDILRLREAHIAAVRRLFCELDVFVFTLGLTEAWEHRVTGQVYPAAPGTIAGSHDPDEVGFVNFRYSDVMSDLQAFWALLKAVNPKARMILTVSPVPLTATASGGHVLAATTYSKSVLRAVAGDFAQDHAEVSYFPSYEIISAAPFMGSFFNPDKRTVNPRGVKFVMEHFFGALVGFDQPEAANAAPEVRDLAVVCEEGALEKYA